MPNYAVTCANRESGAEYRVLADAASPAEAAQSVAAGGHMVGRVDAVESGADAMRAVVDELRGIRQDLLAVRKGLSPRAIFRGFHYRIIWALLMFIPLAVVLFGGLWFIMQIVNEVLANRA
jgi:hypothetical protein